MINSQAPRNARQSDKVASVKTHTGPFQQVKVIFTRKQKSKGSYPATLLLGSAGQNEA